MKRTALVLLEQFSGLPPFVMSVQCPLPHLTEDSCSPESGLVNLSI